MNYVVTRCLKPVEGVTRTVMTDLRDLKYPLAPNLNFKSGVEISHLAVGD